MRSESLEPSWPVKSGASLEFQRTRPPAEPEAAKLSWSRREPIASPGRLEALEAPEALEALGANAAWLSALAVTDPSATVAAPAAPAAPHPRTMARIATRLIKLLSHPVLCTPG